MARIHFPGRPGQRFGRIRVNYQVQQDEFEGFTAEDIANSKLALEHLTVEQGFSEAEFKEVLEVAGVSPMTFPSSRNASSLRITESKNNLERQRTTKCPMPMDSSCLKSFSPVRVRAGMRDVVRRSYAEINKHGLSSLDYYNSGMRQTSSESTFKVTELAQPLKVFIPTLDINPESRFSSSSDSRTLLTTVKSENRDLCEEVKKVPSSDEDAVVCKTTKSAVSSPVKLAGVKERSKKSSQAHAAKKLLERAKKGPCGTKDGVKVGETSLLGTDVPVLPVRTRLFRRKTFALPARSARSSRVIIPKKRNMQDFDFSAAYADEKKCKADEGKVVALKLADPTKIVLKVETKKQAIEETIPAGNSVHSSAVNKNSDLDSDGGERIREEISKYANTMAKAAKEKAAAGRKVGTQQASSVSSKTSEASSPRAASDVVVVNNQIVVPGLLKTWNESKENPVVNKVNYGAKIERMLRSQWEGRLRDTTSSDPEVIAAEKRKAKTKASNRLQAKNILRKARLQLNRRTLMRLRQPDSLRKLSEQFEKDQDRVTAPMRLCRFPTVQLEPLESVSPTVRLPTLPSLTVKTSSPPSSTHFSPQHGTTMSVCGDVWPKHTFGSITHHHPSCCGLEGSWSKNSTCSSSSSSSLSSPVSSPTPSPSCKKGNGQVMKPKPVAAPAISADIKNMPMISPCITISRLNIEGECITLTKEDVAKLTSRDVVRPATKMDEPEESTNRTKHRERNGPRIKHVCRRASVVLGFSPARFSGNGKLFSSESVFKRSPFRKKHKKFVKLDDDDSEGLRKPRKTKLSNPRTFKRARRCRKCSGCLVPDCRKCIYCLDMVKYGGEGKLKQACKLRICITPLLPANCTNISCQKRKDEKPRKRPRHSASYERVPSPASDWEDVVIDANDTGHCDDLVDVDCLALSTDRVVKDVSVYHGDHAGKQETTKSQITHRVFVPRLLKQKEREKNNGRCGLLSHPRPSQGLSSSKNASLSGPLFNTVANGKRNSLLNVNFWREYDLDEIWECGVSMIFSSLPPIQVSCYLCGSIGKEELIYCALCCEPFHPYCLDCDDSFLKNNIDNWCCRRCEYCQVCGQRGDLLKCNTCQNTYHAACFASNYPSRPSKNKIWVCASCVKCKRCGATSPGDSSSAEWRCDFTLCNECGLLIEKGNACPICKQCYEDDGYQAKALQCSKCELLVHVECDNLTDDMYQILKLNPDISYTCSVCSPDNNKFFISAVNSKLIAGFKTILRSILHSKNARHLINVKDETFEKKVKPISKPTFEERMKALQNPRSSNNVMKKSDEANDSALKYYCKKEPEKVVNSMDVIHTASDEIISVPADLPPLAELKVIVEPLPMINFDIPTILRESSDLFSSDTLCSLVQNSAPSVECPPIDIRGVQRKVEDQRYLSVMAFFDDVVRVIQTDSSSHEKEISALRLLVGRALEKAFPWFKSDFEALWGEQDSSVKSTPSIPSVPPYDDHSYAEYVSQSSSDDLPQPSIFRRPSSTSDNFCETTSPTSEIRDKRMCVLCCVVGDCALEDCGRLLYCGQDEWIHLNCALWSAEVFEEVDGSLQHVHAAISRGLKMKCENCFCPGATIGCCVKGCPANYHFLCARSIGAAFQEDKKMYCSEHLDSVTCELVKNDGFVVRHIMYVDLEGIHPKWTKKGWHYGLDPSCINILVGSLTIEYLGEVTNESDTVEAIIPINFRTTRVYWSTKNPRQRVVYTFRTILENPVVENAVMSPVLENRTIEHVPASDEVVTGCSATVEDDPDALQESVGTLLQDLLDDIADKDVEQLAMMIYNEGIEVGGEQESDGELKVKPAEVEMEKNSRLNDAGIVDELKEFGLDLGMLERLQAALGDGGILNGESVLILNDGLEQQNGSVAAASVNGENSEDSGASIESLKKIIQDLLQMTSESDVDAAGSLTPPVANSRKAPCIRGGHGSDVDKNRNGHGVVSHWNGSLFRMEHHKSVRRQADTCLNNNNNSHNHLKKKRLDKNVNIVLCEVPSNGMNSWKCEDTVCRSDVVADELDAADVVTTVPAKRKRSCSRFGNNGVSRASSMPVVTCDGNVSVGRMELPPEPYDKCWSDGVEEYDLANGIPSHADDARFNVHSTLLKSNVLNGECRADSERCVDVNRKCLKSNNDPVRGAQGGGISGEVSNSAEQFNSTSREDGNSTRGNALSTNDTRRHVLLLTPPPGGGDGGGRNDDGSKENFGKTDGGVAEPGRSRQGVPLRCPTCKRVYRTEESFQRHVEGCDFEVESSTSEEDEVSGHVVVVEPSILPCDKDASSSGGGDDGGKICLRNEGGGAIVYEAIVETPMDAPVLNISVAETSVAECVTADEEPFIPVPVPPPAARSPSRSFVRKTCVRASKRILPKVCGGLSRSAVSPLVPSVGQCPPQHRQHQQQTHVVQMQGRTVMIPVNQMASSASPFQSAAAHHLQGPLDHQQQQQPYNSNHLGQPPMTYLGRINLSHGQLTSVSLNVPVSSFAVPTIVSSIAPAYYHPHHHQPAASDVSLVQPVVHVATPLHHQQVTSCVLASTVQPQPPDIIVQPQVTLRDYPVSNVPQPLLPSHNLSVVEQQVVTSYPSSLQADLPLSSRELGCSGMLPSSAVAYPPQFAAPGVPLSSSANVGCHNSVLAQDPRSMISPSVGHGIISRSSYLAASSVSEVSSSSTACEQQQTISRLCVAPATSVTLPPPSSVSLDHNGEDEDDFTDLLKKVSTQIASLASSSSDKSPVCVVLPSSNVAEKKQRSRHSLCSAASTSATTLATTTQFRNSATNTGPKSNEYLPTSSSMLAATTTTAAAGASKSSSEFSPYKRDRGTSSKAGRPRVMFEITSEDGFHVKSATVDEAWRAVADRVQEARAAAHLRHLSTEGLRGLDVLGVTHRTVRYLLEQMPGAQQCRKFRFRYHEQDEELPENPSGCARTESFKTRKNYDIFNFLVSHHRQPPEYDPSYDDDENQSKTSRRVTSMDLPMAMRFRHIKNTARDTVGVYRSLIHGRGLFCRRLIDAGEMVIEYAGELFRSILTDKREKYYDAKGIGCYMFKIDESEVVDATMHGNAARFINHSCDPNCYSKVITVDGKKHIVIFALRRILPGEELTYDYKFPIEDVKIPCTCGARRCRRYLN